MLALKKFFVNIDILNKFAKNPKTNYDKKRKKLPSTKRQAEKKS